MNNFASFLLLAFLCAGSPLSAQLFLTIKSMPESDVYGVYVRPCDTLQPTTQTITGSGQVTIVAVMGSQISDLTNVSGIWGGDALIYSPVENPGMMYLSFGLQSDSPAIVYQSQTETLLFTIKVSGNPGDQPSLIDNETDPFAQLPNSLGSNPGNDLTVVDFGVSPMGIYGYSGIYTPEEFDCAGQVSTAAVEFAGQGPSFRLFPNPAQYRLSIRLPNGSDPRAFQFNLWDAAMTQLPTQLTPTSDELIELDIRDLPAGNYFITMENGSRILQIEQFLKL